MTARTFTETELLTAESEGRVSYEHAVVRDAHCADRATCVFGYVDDERCPDLDVVMFSNLDPAYHAESRELAATLTGAMARMDPRTGEPQTVVM